MMPVQPSNHPWSGWLQATTDNLVHHNAKVMLGLFAHLTVTNLTRYTNKWKWSVSVRADNKKLKSAGFVDTEGEARSVAISQGHALIRKMRKILKDENYKKLHPKTQIIVDEIEEME